MKHLIPLLLAFVSLPITANAQCVRCSQALLVSHQATLPTIVVDTPMQVTEYVPVTKTVNVPVEYAPVCQTSQVIDFDAACALEAAREFQSCRSSGGRFFTCLLGAGISYLDCSGGFETASGRTGVFGRMRARRAGRRALRQARSMQAY